jgi:putative tryptophan/tyrosine transport system substrate-binding protein
MELFREITPAVKHVIFVTNTRGASYEESKLLTREAAKKMGLTLTEVEVQATNAEQVKKHVLFVTRKVGEALLLPPEASLIAATEQFADQAIKEKLPAVGPNVQTVKRGLLAAYSSNYYSLGQQGAKLVDKILRGARPTDLPIEQPYKLELVVNLRTAKAIGVKVPRETLLRADEIVE